MAEDERRAVELHLHGCASCQQIVDRLAGLKRRLKILPVVKTSPEFETLLRMRLRLDRYRLQPWSHGLVLSPGRVMAVSAFALVMLAGAIYTVNRRTPAMAPALVRTISSPARVLRTTMADSAVGRLPVPAYRRFTYALDGVTIPRTVGVPLHISSVGVERYQSMQTDSTAKSLASPEDVEPLLVSF